MRGPIRSLGSAVLRTWFRAVPLRVRSRNLRWLRRKAFQVPARVPPGFYSQKGQDYRIARMLGHRRRGFFVDVGAFDGVTGSNTCYFERELGWRGLCIEANPDLFETLRRQRTARCVCMAVGRRAGTSRFLKLPGAWAQLSGVEEKLSRGKLLRAGAAAAAQSERIEIRTAPLADILEAADVGTIDLLSVDVEGSEMEVLEGHDFQRFPTHVICVENSRPDNEIERYLRRRGFRLAMTIGREEEIYVRRPRTSVARSAEAR